MKLDKQQEAVVNSKSKNILVVAGAGSGKTRVLTERVKELIKRGVEPHNIVAITFTNMAAEEMKMRLKDEKVIGDVFIGTIHSFANRIYANSGEIYSILTQEADLLIMEELLNKPKYKALTYKRYLQYLDIKKKVDMGQLSEKAVSEFMMPSEEDVLNRVHGCAGDYNAICKRDNIITFEELIGYAKKYYESLQASIEYILVDEFQDIDTKEYEFIRALNADNYFFVGDDWQAIYGFKGGNVSIFKSLYYDKKFTKYHLSNNYRNTPEIQNVGLRVISQISDKIEKDVVCLNKDKGHITTQSKAQQSRIVSLLNKDKDNWRDWFVLTRSNKEAYALADLLDDESIDYAFLRKSDMTLEELQEAMKMNQVKIMTVHSAKGLENKKVILYGNFPIVQPSYFRNIEERKVMYVGVTRAIEELHLFN